MMGLDIAGVGAVAGLADTLINKIWPDKTEKEKAEIAAAVMVVKGQMDINQTEAASPNIFVAGWRPFIGWVCGVACAWNWVGLPVVKVALAVVGHRLELSPADLTEMLPLLLGMLGLGGLRTAEKIHGVAR
jgi:hypothetical protein